MRGISIRNAEAGDFSRICALNQHEVRHTSPMDLPRVSELAGLAGCFTVACVDDVVCGFLLAMRSDASYENANFSWFAKRHRHFIYVDRVVVSSAARGKGIGTLLYENVFSFARANALSFVVCEYNIEPPNEASRVFHDKFGFKEQGTQWVANGTKRVSLQLAQA